MPSLTKEINRLISKEMYVFLFDIFNGFLKTDVLKTSILLERKFGEVFILALSYSAVFPLQKSVSDFF